MRVLYTFSLPFVSFALFFIENKNLKKGKEKGKKNYFGIYVNL